MAATALKIAHAAGALAGLGEMMTKWYGGDSWEIGKTSVSVLVGALTGILAATMIANPFVAVGLAIAGGYALSTSAEAAWETFVPRAWSVNIRDTVSRLFGGAQRATARRDPLSLDLDSDGLETVPSTNGVLFDHDADVIKTSSGWVKPDDGFLVLDRDGNGAIDSGRELFCDSTPLPSGGAARDGFEALSAEDTNADGKVDAADALWSQLRIWRDLNQDGVSQGNELFTLASLGIASISTAATEHAQVLPDGNRIADLGTFTRTDGSSGTTDEIGKTTDIDLAEDTFHRQFTDSIPLVPGAEALPDMQGSGQVRDLREAASQSVDLFATLQAYSSLTTRAAQRAALDTLLAEWADTSTMKGTYASSQEVANADYAFIVGNWRPFHTGWGFDKAGKTGYDLQQEGINVLTTYEKLAPGRHVVLRPGSGRVDEAHRGAGGVQRPALWSPGVFSSNCCTLRPAVA